MRNASKINKTYSSQRILLEHLLMRSQIITNMGRSEDLRTKMLTISYEEYSNLIEIAIQQLRTELLRKQ